MAAELPTVRFGRIRWRNPAIEIGKFRAVAVVALALGVPEKHLVIKQVNAGCNLDVEIPEEEEVWKQDGAGCN